MQDKKTAAIILAAGQGRRMNSSVQKQYMLINEYPVLYYAIKVFEASSVEEIVLVTGASEIEYCQKEIVDRYGFKKVKKIVAGGKERHDSVYNGLKEIEGEYVLIHDGARPMVTVDIIERTIEAVKENNACTTGMPVKDTIKMCNDELIVTDTPPRKYLWQIQTPQAFETKLIKTAHELLREKYSDSMNVTDDCMLVENIMNKPVKLVEGSYMNIKVTTPEDINIAEVFLKGRE